MKKIIKKKRGKAARGGARTTANHVDHTTTGVVDEAIGAEVA
jgi:hypothetical protein